MPYIHSHFKNQTNDFLLNLIISNKVNFKLELNHKSVVDNYISYLDLNKVKLLITSIASKTLQYLENIYNIVHSINTKAVAFYTTAEDFNNSNKNKLKFPLFAHTYKALFLHLPRHALQLNALLSSAVTSAISTSDKINI